MKNIIIAILIFIFAEILLIHYGQLLNDANKSTESNVEKNITSPLLTIPEKDVK